MLKKRIVHVLFVLLALAIILVGCQKEETIVPDDTLDKETDVVSENTEEDTETDGDIIIEESETVDNTLNLTQLFPEDVSRDFAKDRIGQKLTDFYGKDLAGNDISFNDFKGKNLIIDVMVTTCPACIDMYPHIAEYKEALASSNYDNIDVVTFLPIEDTSHAEDFFTANSYRRDESLVVGVNQENFFTGNNIQYTPTIFFVNEEGYIQYTHIGAGVTAEGIAQMADLAFGESTIDTLNN